MGTLKAYQWYNNESSITASCVSCGQFSGGNAVFLGSLTMHMGEFSMVHWLIFGVIAILLFGNRLPNIARSLGRCLVEFKRGMDNLEGEFKTNLFDPTHP